MTYPTWRHDGVEVLQDDYVPTWRDNDDGSRSRLICALTRNGVPLRMFCSPENFKLFTADHMPDDCRSWVVYSISNDAGPFKLNLSVPPYQAKVTL